MRNDRDDEFEPFHASFPTARVLDELQLYGHRPHQDEPDPRPLPDQRGVEAALGDVFDALVSVLGDTRLEPDLENLLWSTVNLFHRAAAQVQRQLDRNEDEQKRSQAEQDGSEIRSVELERLIAEGVTMIERRNAFEAFRDCAADLFEAHLGTAWRPRTGSRMSHRNLTAAVIDSRDFLAAKRRAEIEPLTRKGPRSPSPAASTATTTAPSGARSTGSRQASGHDPHARRRDQGAEFIASRWADALFRPDWSRRGKAAPFKRNDRLLATLPIGVIVFPGSGSPTTLPTRRADSGSRSGDSQRRASAETTRGRLRSWPRPTFVVSAQVNCC